MNADQDYLYLAKDAKVLVLDGETGTETRVIEPAEVTGEIKWMGRVGRTLHMLSGTPDAWDGPSSEINQKRLDGRIGFGTRFTAYNISSNSVVWSHEAGGIVDNREVGVSNGKLFYYARGVELVCLDAGSGALQWRLTRQSLLDSLDAHLGLMPGQFGIMSEISGFLCSPEALVICSIEDSSIISLSTTNGDVLWSIPRKGGRGQHKVVVDSMLFNTSVDMFWGSPDKGKHCAMHIVTGEPLRDIMGSVRSHGCVRSARVPPGSQLRTGPSVSTSQQVSTWVDHDYTKDHAHRAISSRTA
jgi:outer membrane protein assembly factor BamB